MLQNCTILCPNDEPEKVVAYLRDLLQNNTDIHVVGDESDWSKIEMKSGAASLTLNRQIQRERGDSYSKMVLGMHNYFRKVNTPMEATKQDVLNRVAAMELAIGVVAEPEFAEEAHHFDCIFGIATALNAMIWNGNGVINADGTLILDRDGNSDLV